MVGLDPVKLQVISRRLRAMDRNGSAGDDAIPNSYGSGFNIAPSNPIYQGVYMRHQQALVVEAQQMLATLPPQVASQAHMEVLVSGGT